MAKVTLLFKTDSVYNCLCDAAEMGMKEIVLIGKKQDGGFYLRISPCENAYVYIGMLEVLKQEFVASIQENGTGE
jgi:hypothetical protein